MINKAIITLASAALISLVLAFVTGASGQGACTSDLDLDGICDVPGLDNCVLIANPDQRDNDEDGYGNLCDADVSQDCRIGAPDLSLIFAFSKNAAPWIPPSLGAFDVNEDGIVGGPDFLVVRAETYKTPGPTSRSCADCTATPPAVAGLGVCP